MAQKYIYQMSGLTKKFGQHEVLSDIWLAFYPGAKIGVLGRNGSGKSTLLRIGNFGFCREQFCAGNACVVLPRTGGKK